MHGFRLIVLSIGLAAGVVASAASTEEPLRPEEAFRYDVRQVENDIIVRWTIEPGHYLYRARMSFASGSDALVIGEPIFTPGEPHYDEFFGDMEIYRNRTTVRIPIIELGQSAARATL